MSSTILDEYEIWKRRRLTRPNSNIMNYFADGIEIGEKLLGMGCHKDREGLDIQEQVDILQEQLARMKSLQRQDS